jgi:hypothetical protein
LDLAFCFSAARNPPHVISNQRPIARRRKTKRMEGSVPGYKQATPPGFSRSVFGSWATGAGKDELFEVGYPSRDA